MSLKTASPQSIFGLLEKDHHLTFQKINQLYEALNKLRYEGKINFGKNVAELRTLVAYFKNELAGHMRDEEKTLFPFLQVHIPRLEPMVYLLLSEHEDFRNSLDRLTSYLGQLKKTKGDATHLIDKTCEQGTYLIFLLRGHMWVESHSLYRAADKELRQEEKRVLVRQIKKKRF